MVNELSDFSIHRVILVASETKLLKQEKNYIELDAGDCDISVPAMVREYAAEDGDVGFASCIREHPVIGTPRLTLRTEKKDAAKVVSDSIKKARKALDAITTGLKK